MPQGHRPLVYIPGWRASREHGEHPIRPKGRCGKVLCRRGSLKLLKPAMTLQFPVLLTKHSFEVKVLPRLVSLRDLTGKRVSIIEGR
jgi:hypothetical protein